MAKYVSLIMTCNKYFRLKNLRIKSSFSLKEISHEFHFHYIKNYKYLFICTLRVRTDNNGLSFNKFQANPNLLEFQCLVSYGDN